jgi:hypothetical protein
MSTADHDPQEESVVATFITRLGKLDALGERLLCAKATSAPAFKSAGGEHTAPAPRGRQVSASGRPTPCASGLLSGGFEDQPCDFLRMRDQREMAGLHLDGPGAHALGHEALEPG